MCLHCLPRKKNDPFLDLFVLDTLLWSFETAAIQQFASAYSSQWRDVAAHGLAATQASWASSLRGAPSHRCRSYLKYPSMLFQKNKGPAFICKSLSPFRRVALVEHTPPRMKNEVANDKWGLCSTSSEALWQGCCLGDTLIALNHQGLFGLPVFPEKRSRRHALNFWLPTKRSESDNVVNGPHTWTGSAFEWRHICEIRVKLKRRCEKEEEMQTYRVPPPGGRVSS